MIKDLKELQALLKLCRKQGITEIKLHGVEIRFGDLPKKSTEADDDDNIPTDEPSVEELMNWSIPRENLQG